MKATISKTYNEFGYTKKIFDEFEIEVDESKITSIVAPIKSGKTTLLRILSGLETSDGNTQKIPLSFYVGSEPQSFPWMNLKQTIQFANPKTDTSQIKLIAEQVGLEGYEEHFPNNKSLGFRFRIVLAAAIAKQSSIILLDEPFSMMDERTKNEIYQLIIDINKKLNIGFVLGTSNLGEAVLLSDEIILLKNLPHKNAERFSVEYKNNSLQDRINSEAYTKNLSILIESINKMKTQKQYSISL